MRNIYSVEIVTLKIFFINEMEIQGIERMSHATESIADPVVASYTSVGRLNH